MGAVYTQLSITERRRIERWRHAKVPVDEMARVLKRCRSTIFRELKRNHFSDECMPKCDGYYGAAAHLMQAHRRARDRKLIKYPELCKRVIERIKDGWTPEQIGNRMIQERAKLRVCHALPDRVLRSNVPRRKPFIVTSTPKKACERICGGTCQRTVLLAVRDVLEDAENPNSTVMSASYSAPLSGHCCAIPCRAMDDVAHRREFGHSLPDRRLQAICREGGGGFDAL